MIRIFAILMLLCGPLPGQGISYGVHGCGSWLKGKFESGGFSYESENHESIYGIGGDVMFKPPISPIGVEAGFTYLSRSETEDDIGFETRGHPLYLNGKFYFSPLLYVGGGINYTFWDVEVDGEEFDIDSKVGYQGGIGVEFGAAGMKLYGSAFYFVQKGEVKVDDFVFPVEDVLDTDLKGLQIRAGIRFGG